MLQGCLQWFRNTRQRWMYNEQLDHISCQLDVIMDTIDRSGDLPTKSATPGVQTPTTIPIPPPPPLPRLKVPSLTPPTIDVLDEKETFELKDISSSTQPMIPVSTYPTVEETDEKETHSSSLLDSLKSEIAKRGKPID